MKYKIIVIKCDDIEPNSYMFCVWDSIKRKCRYSYFLGKPNKRVNINFAEYACYHLKYNLDELDVGDFDTKNMESIANYIINLFIHPELRKLIYWYEI